MFPDDISQGEGAIITDPDEGTVKAIISDCLGKGSVKIAFFSSRQDELINLFNKNFDIIPASGGIVQQCIDRQDTAYTPRRHVGPA